MRKADRRSLTRLATGGTTAGLLVAVTATGAQAAAPTFQVTQAAVLAALPGASSFPPGVKLVGKAKDSKPLVDLPCGTAAHKVTFTGSTEVGAVYSTSSTGAASATDSVWTISVAVFRDHTAAAAAEAKLVKAEVACSRVQSETQGGVTATLTRTVSAVDTSEKGQWKGYRTVAHVTTSASAKGARIFDTYFERGNVLVKVEELAPLTPKGGAKQDLQRKTVTVATLTKLDAAG